MEPAFHYSSVASIGAAASKAASHLAIVLRQQAEQMEQTEESV